MTRTTSSLCVCAALLAGLVACSSDERSITIAVSTEEPAPSIAETIRSMLESRDYSVTIETAPDPTEAVDAITAGRLELAIIEEPDKPQPGLVTLAPLYPSVLHVLHRRDFAPQDFAALIRGASVYAGPEGSAAYRLLMKLADDLDVVADEFNMLDNPWTESPDVYFIFGGLLSKESQRQLQGFQFFNFARDGDIAGGSVADAIALKHHHLRPFLLPRGVYSQLADGPVLTLSIRNVLATHEDLDADLALDIAAMLFRNAQEISQNYPLVTNELNESMNRSDLMLPLHAGARRYLDRDRPGFIERNVDLLALYLTIFLAILSGIVAWIRYRSQVRKDRVDVYYAKLLDIRRDQASADTSERGSYRGRIMDVQHEVMQLLIDERVAADESLVAFMSLSNQMLRELGDHENS